MVRKCPFIAFEAKDLTSLCLPQKPREHCLNLRKSYRLIIASNTTATIRDLRYIRLSSPQIQRKRMVKEHVISAYFFNFKSPYVDTAHTVVLSQYISN